jgi:hypothetical protein
MEDALAMHSMNRVVDQLAAELAERRRLTINRDAAYLALAQAILSDDLEPQDNPTDHRLLVIRHPRLAA